MSWKKDGSESEFIVGHFKNHISVCAQAKTNMAGLLYPLILTQTYDIIWYHNVRNDNANALQ